MIGTFFFLGELPRIPGTWGSLGGLLLYLALGSTTSVWHVFVFGVLLILGFCLAGPASELFGKKDARPVVIDEAASIFLVFFGIRPSFWIFVTGFVLYRLLDVVKPFPARQLERVPGSAGIMLDDLVCGIYGQILMRALSLFLP